MSETNYENNQHKNLFQNASSLETQADTSGAVQNKEPTIPTSVKIPAYEMDEFDKKIAREFPGKVVRKDLTALMKRGANVPTFVLEYLLGMYCTTTDFEMAQEGLRRVDKILSENYVRPGESEKVKSKIREKGQLLIIDKLHAWLDEGNDIYAARLDSLNIQSFQLPEEYAQKYSKILMGGIWCILRFEYLRLDDEEEDDPFAEQPSVSKRRTGKRRSAADSPFHLISLRPIQMPDLDLDEFISHRKNFTTKEWTDLILRSAGYEPSELSEREQMHFLERMVPLIEHNYNMCELGPRGTGKSHLYSELSPYAYLLSGGQTTTARLFANLSRYYMGIGLVGLWDTIAFDEVAGMHFKDLDAIQIMKGYMASGTFGRGTQSYNADASMVFEGNINDTVENILKTTHLFDPFPPEFNQDSAFFDRIHYYLPGWEIPKMRHDILTKRYGLISDCLSEFCHSMRRRDFSHGFDQWFRLNSDFNQRDEIAVRKTFSGLAKLLFPDGQIKKEDARRILEYAIEGRRRVKEQLKTMAGIEFIDTDLGYQDIADPLTPHIIQVPEQKSDTLIPECSIQPGHVFGIGHAFDGEMAIYRLENKAIPGEMKFSTEGVGSYRSIRESMKAAFEFFIANVNSVAPGIHAETNDYLLYYNNLQGKTRSDEVSLAEFIGLCSAATERPVLPALAIPGVLRMSGTLEKIKDLSDIMNVAKNAGARMVLLPTSAIQDLQSVPNEVMGSVSPIFYQDGDAIDAARRALGV